MRPMGWLAMLSCAPLIFSLAHPPLPVLILLWVLAGAGGAYQLAAAAAFVTALPAARRVRAFAVAQSGLLAAQALGILTGGAVAQRIGPTGAVALAGLLGLLAAAALATDWTRRRTELIGLLMSGRETGIAAAAPSPATAPAAALPAQLPPGPAEPPPTTSTLTAQARAAQARAAQAPTVEAPATGPPMLNLPVAERGTGLSAPAPPAEATETTEAAETTELAETTGPEPVTTASVTPVPEHAPERAPAADQPTGPRGTGRCAPG
jgi:MFS family permease